MSDEGGYRITNKDLFDKIEKLPEIMAKIYQTKEKAEADKAELKAYIDPARMFVFGLAGIILLAVGGAIVNFFVHAPK